MINRKYLLLYLVLMPTFHCAFGQDAIITDRPSQSDGTFVIPQGTFQIESGVNYGAIGLSESSDSVLHSFVWGSLFRIGIIDGLEVRLIAQPTSVRIRTPLETVNSRSGMTDLQLGFKARILETTNERSTAVSVLASLITPTGTKGLSIEQTGIQGKVIINQEISEILSLLANIGYENLGIGNGQLLYSLMWGIGLTERLALFIEPYGRGVNFSEWFFSADAGFTYRVSDNFQVDYTLGAGLNHDMNFHMAGVGIRFPAKRD